LKCEFDYCIYNENYFCRLDNVEINETGMCSECIIVSLPEKTLAEYKRKQLIKIIDKYDGICGNG